MAAKVLCEAGASVVMLEAGGMWDSAKDSKMSAWPYDSPRRGAATPTQPFGEVDGFICGLDLAGEPYTPAHRGSSARGTHLDRVPRPVRLLGGQQLRGR